MLKENRTLGGELRNQLVATVTEMLEKDDRIMVLDADLGGASFFLRFKKSHPDRFVDCGICEANMVGVAAGLSLRGYIPVVHTMSAFVARRALDQLYISCAYQNNTINVFGSDPGICSGFDGGTHTCFEDLAIMRTIPHAIVCDPCDQVQLDWMVRECLSRNDGAIHYIRAYRKNVTEVYEPGTKFELGKGKVLIPGDEVLLVGSGYLMGDALTAAEELRALADVCLKHDLYIIADEIYYKLLYDGVTFTSIAALSPEIKALSLIHI